MKHLSEEQFAEWASGERSEAVAQHLRECADCLAEVRELNSALEGFKAEITESAARRVSFTGAQVRARASEPQRSRSVWKLLPVPVLAAAAVLAVMLYNPAPEPVTNVPQQVAANDDADNALLMAINSDVYRATPAALKPVASLNQDRNQILTSSQRKK